ncbi:hypothetical protein EYF80_012001 [Liparis tanakae]|uniref:Uncharacterized protein n=1 Tax=Liparis tanakae TaxID=230148 RepID=A0A4Z2IKJ7_9TELE|nr:hypothetical protein EYF80_012001 [Liparis tanakae]
MISEKKERALGFPLKDDHSAPLVPCGQELSSVVELNSGDDVSWGATDVQERMEEEKERCSRISK